MKLPSVPGAITGVRDRWRARGSSAADGSAPDDRREPGRLPPGGAPGSNTGDFGRGDDGARGAGARRSVTQPATATSPAAKPPAVQRDDAGLPMPLALQGVVEMLAVGLVGLLLGALLLGAVWVAGGFATLGAGGSLRLAGLGWLLAHGTPLDVRAAEGLPLDGGGTVTLVPLGLTLIPFALAVVAGRRIARACWRGQFLVPFCAGMVAYALLAAVVALVSRTDQVSVDLLSAALCSLLPVGLGALVGGWSVSRSLAAVLGTDAASWLQRTSQYSRWAGSYVWAVIRAGSLAAAAAVAGGALLLVVALAGSWGGIVTVYQDLGTGTAGDTALTALQFGFLPNMVLWALAWASGAGFAVGSGTLTSPFQTTMGPLPQFPALAALPAGDPWTFAPAVLALPVLAGLLAGWWFCREGENHLDDWMAIRLPLRWFTFLLSTLLTVVFIAAVGSGIVAVLTWLSHGSLGIGRLTDIGPHAGEVFLWLGAELAVGAAVGYLVGPWLEREGYRSHTWQDSDDDAAPPVAAHAAGGRTSREETAPAAVRVEPSRSPGAGAAAGELSAPEPTRASRGAETSGSARTGGVRPLSVGPRGSGSTRLTRPAAEEPGTGHGLSRREEARRRRAERRSAKRKAARLAALDRENER
ncbi:cell division protein PerM [Kocuria tytonicola]|uniref:cell division protein PerM n=1 Tax=Kocuria tytonicola TaxID=2055946 RepID=UPI003F6C8C7E